MRTITEVKINRKDKRKLEEYSELTGLPMSKTFGVFSETMPIIINSEIIRKPRSKEKKLKITFQQVFNIPVRKDR